jgi:hypothetical protein
MPVGLKQLEEPRMTLMARIKEASPLAATMVLMALLCASGCSKPKFYPVKGQVVIFGVGPLTEGEVQFRPRSRPDLIAKGPLQKDGSFALSTPGHGEGVLEGSCQAAIIAPQRAGKSIIAERFADFDAADRNFTVEARDENFFMIQVDKPGK